MELLGEYHKFINITILTNNVFPADATNLRKLGLLLGNDTKMLTLKTGRVYISTREGTTVTSYDLFALWASSC
jgi:hypothetical protein